MTWAAWRHFTLDAEAYRQWIGGQLGLDVRISDVVQTAPGTTRLEDLNILDPESGLGRRVDDTKAALRHDRMTSKD